MIRWIITILGIISAISVVTLSITFNMLLSRSTWMYLLAVHDKIIVDYDVPNTLLKKIDALILKHGRYNIAQFKPSLRVYVVACLIAAVISIIPVYNVIVMCNAPLVIKLYLRSLKYCETFCDILDNYKENE